MLGLEIIENKQTRTPSAEKTKALIAFCRSKGLILIPCGTYGNVIRVLTPFVITDEHLERGFAIMEEGLTAVSQ